MPLNKNIHKVMVIGSGPIIIGQAAEFDYAGSQACKALKEQGLEVVLVNSNPATLMTDHAMADHIYIEPLIPETIKRIILNFKFTRRTDWSNSLYGTCKKRIPGRTWS